MVKKVNVKFAFYKTSSPLAGFIDKLIAKWTGGNHSHTEIILDYQWIGMYTDGIKRKPLQPINYDYWDIVDVGDIEITVDNYNNILKYINNVGKDAYDWTGILFSYIIPLGIDQRKKLVCSEFATRIGQWLGISILWDYQAHKLSPVDLFKILSKRYPVNPNKKK